MLGNGYTKVHLNFFFFFNENDIALLHTESQNNLILFGLLREKEI